MIVRELFARLGLEVDRDGFDAADRLFVGLRGSLAAVGAAVGSVGLGIAAAIHQTAQYAAETRNMAATSGIATRHFQAMAYAASTVSVDAGDLRDAFLDLSERTYDAIRGSEEYASSFRKLGISLKDANGKQRDGLDIMLQLADALQKHKNKGEAAALASKLLGETGARLVPLLQRGRGAIAELGQEAQDLGMVMDGEATEAAISYGKELARAQGAAKGLGIAIGSRFMPAAERMLKWGREWLTKHQGKIVDGLERMVDLFGKALPWAAGVAAVFALYKVGVAVAALTAWMGGLTAATVTWGSAALIAGARAALASTAAGLGWFALIALIALAIEDMYVFFKGGDSLMGRFGEKWTKLTDRFAATDPDDWALTRALKSLLRDILDIEGALDRMGRWLGSLVGKDFAPGEAGRQQLRNFGIGFRSEQEIRQDPYRPKTIAESWGGVFGSSASPAATAAALSSNSTTNDNSQRRTVNVGGITINQRYTSGPLEPVPQLREAVRQAADELFEYETAAAGAAHPKRRP